MFLRRVRYWLKRPQHEAELAEEIETHRVMIEEDLTRSGLSRHEAAQASRRALGNALIARGWRLAPGPGMWCVSPSNGG
jgi:hypothetical protein